MATISRSHRLRAQNSVRRLQRADLLGLGVQRADALNLHLNLGHEKGDETRAGPGNSRDDTSRKRVLTDLGAAGIDTPRDRTGSWAVDARHRVLRWPRRSRGKQVAGEVHVADLREDHQGLRKTRHTAT